LALKDPIVRSRTSCLLLPILLFCVFDLNAQQADFSAPVKSGCFPLTVHFKDLSTGSNLTGWLWDFGNGNSSTLQEPSAVYTQPGLYTVSLKVTNANGSDTEVKANFVVVFDEPKPNFNFTIPPNQKCAPLAVEFQDQSIPGSGSISSWNWTFGDGGTSTAKSPSYTYTSAGTYTVSLNAKNSFGCERTMIGNSTIQVDGIEASFTTQSESYCTAPASVQFTSSVNESNVTYEWSFGDGSSSTAASPLHTYAAGNFTAVLKVQNAAGCSDTFFKTILVGGEGGVDFTMSVAKICIGQEVTFERTVSGSVLTQQWTFPDGSVSNQNSVTKAFTIVGKQNVTFTASLVEKDCNSVITKELEVVPNAIADFTHAPACDGSIMFTNKSSNAVGYHWDFGDNGTATEVSPTHEYYLPQQYKVKLKALNVLGCESFVEKLITVFAKPQAEFSPSVEQGCSGTTLSGCAPFTVQFQDKSTSPVAITKFEWDFGDGTKSTLPNPSHTFTKKGVYLIKLSITTANGCQSSMTSRAHVADVAPTGKFVVPKTTICAGEELKFEDQSINANYLCWNYGDGTQTGGSSGGYTYMVPGIYTVTLVAKNDGCTNTFVSPQQITVLNPNVNFDIVKSCDEPFKVTLQNASSGYDQIQWTYGDGTPATQDLNHTYATSGNHTIEVTASNAVTGCTMKVIRPVTIQDVEADFAVSNAKPCLDEYIHFHDASQAAIRWQWQFGDGNLTGEKNPVKKYLTPGDFSVSLTVEDSEGCQDTKVINGFIDVLAIRADFDFDATSNCNELEVDFKDATSAAPAVTSWQWNFGDGANSTSQNPVHTYGNRGKYTITLTLGNPEGECTITREDLIDFKNPVPEFTLKKPGFCIGELIQIVNQSAYTSTYLWTVNNFGLLTIFQFRSMNHRLL
jgi:PKD repeat protein